MAGGFRAGKAVVMIGAAWLWAAYLYMVISSELRLRRGRPIKGTVVALRTLDLFFVFFKWPVPLLFF